VFEEFPPGLPLGAVQGTSLDGAETGTGSETGSETESEGGSSGEWAVGGSEWVAHVCSP
jgi:hypothetical protein